MDHRLLVAGEAVAEQLRALIEGLAETCHVAVPEDAEAAGEELLLDPVPLHALGGEEAQQGLGHGQAGGLHAEIPARPATIAAAWSTAFSTSPCSG